jgi:hypothetical protein
LKIYKKKRITETQTVFEKMICDICKRESKRYDWAATNYEADETEIKVIVKQQKGSQSPDGGYAGFGTKIEVDICPDCFATKLIPWLKSQGAVIEEEEWDW